MAVTDVKDELHELIDAMDAAQAVRLLAMVGLLDDPDEVTDEEAEAIRRARDDFAAGRFVRGADLRREFSSGE